MTLTCVKSCPKYAFLGPKFKVPKSLVSKDLGVYNLLGGCGGWGWEGVISDLIVTSETLKATSAPNWYQYARKHQNEPFLACFCTVLITIREIVAKLISSSE